jgi:hypothetical protein
MTSRTTLAGNRRRRKLYTGLWFAALSILIIVLIYREMTAVLYILATLGVTALLVLVAVADLGDAEKPSKDPQRINDSAALGSGITSPFGSKQS